MHMLRNGKLWKKKSASEASSTLIRPWQLIIWRTACASACIYNSQMCGGLRLGPLMPTARPHLLKNVRPCCNYTMIASAYDCVCWHTAFEHKSCASGYYLWKWWKSLTQSSGAPLPICVRAFYLTHVAWFSPSLFHISVKSKRVAFELFTPWYVCFVQHVSIFTTISQLNCQAWYGQNRPTQRVPEENDYPSQGSCSDQLTRSRLISIWFRIQVWGLR